MITSTDNNRIKEARSLQRKRQRLAAGRCLLEGLRLVEDAWRAGARPDRIFFVPAVAETNPALAQLVAEISAAGVESLACTPQVFQSLADTVTPQGIAAVLPTPDLPAPRQPGLVLILDAIGDPGNAGTLLRAAEAAGVGLVLLAPQTVDVFNPKVLRAGMGAHFRLPLRTCADWDEVKSHLDPAWPIFVADAKSELTYDEVNWTQPAVLILGSEAGGPSAPARQMGRPVAIPMRGGTESLNAAMAGTVILFEAARQRRRQ